MNQRLGGNTRDVYAGAAIALSVALHEHHALASTSQSTSERLTCLAKANDERIYLLHVLLLL